VVLNEDQQLEKEATVGQKESAQLIVSRIQRKAPELSFDRKRMSGSIPLTGQWTTLLKTLQLYRTN